MQSDKLLIGLTISLIGSNILVNCINMYLVPLNNFCEKWTVSKWHYGIFFWTYTYKFCTSM